jgi:hypothetical protein
LFGYTQGIQFWDEAPCSISRYKGIEVKVTVRIREVATGKEFDTFQEVEDEYLDGQEFYYGEGNGSCDCNRKLMFGDAQGIQFSDEETPCGSSKYKVRVVVGDQIVLDELND